MTHVMFLLFWFEIRWIHLIIWIRQVLHGYSGVYIAPICGQSIPLSMCSYVNWSNSSNLAGSKTKIGKTRMCGKICEFLWMKSACPSVHCRSIHTQQTHPRQRTSTHGRSPYIEVLCPRTESYYYLLTTLWCQTINQKPPSSGHASA